MDSDLTLKETQEQWHGSYRAYIIGFILALSLTLLSFGIVITKAFSPHYLHLVLIGLAAFQVMVQLICFLHLGQEPKPKYETLIFCFTVLILLILVVGSLWIMHDLNARMMMDMNMNMNGVEHHHD